MHKKKSDLENGFITMIVMMVVILAAVIFLAYKRVISV
jgi:hypothetical protein